MDIRKKISLRISLTVAIILILCALSVYVFSQYYLGKRFRNRLEERALTVITIFIDLKPDNPYFLKTLYNTDINVFPKEALSIYDISKKKIVFSTDPIDEVLHLSYLKNRLHLKEAFKDGKYTVLIKKYKNYYIIIGAIDLLEKEILGVLKIVLALVSIIALILVYWLSRSLANKFLSPILSISEQLSNIFPRNVSDRIKYDNKNDELGTLTTTINELLDKVEKSFKTQRLFISNFSHELKNPLARVFTQIEILGIKYKQNDNYQKALYSLRSDMLLITETVNSLLELESFSTEETGLVKKIERIDEVLLESIEEYLKWNPENEIELDFDNFPSEEEILTYKVNKSTIKIVFKNIIDNGCKFSNDSKVKVKVYEEHKILKISFYNIGEPIPVNQVDEILKPFYRLDQTAKGKKGHGVGLSIVNEIIKIHGMDLEIIPDLEGNFFIIKFLK